MRRLSRRSWIPVACAALALGALLSPMPTPARAAEAPVPLAVITHPGNTLKEVRGPMLKQLFTAQLLFWPDGKAVVALNYPPRHALRVVFDQAVLGMDPQRVGEFWVDQLVRARARPPRKLPSPRLMLRVVAQLKGAVGYMPLDQVTRDVEVLALVKAGKVVPQ